MPMTSNEILDICPACYGVFKYKPYRKRKFCSKKCAANYPETKEKNRRAVAMMFNSKYGTHPMKLKTVKRCGPPKRSTYKGFTDEVKQFVESLVPISTDSGALAPLEVDIFIPSKHIAIETVNIEHRSEIKGGKHKNYHLNKTKIASIKGVRLVHVFKPDWIKNKLAVKSILKNLLTKDNNRIGASECRIKILAPNEKNKFLHNNDVHGTDRSQIRIGLVHKKTDELLAVMTFKPSRFDKNVDWEISRFCCKSGYTIIGAASRLFAHFVKTCDPTGVAVHADRRYFSGEVYLKLGFSFIRNTHPTCFYIVDSYDAIESANNWRKDGLSRKLMKFDKKLSEWENMKINGFDRIWDCGHSKWVWKS